MAVVTCSDDLSADLGVGPALRGVRVLRVALPEERQAEAGVLYLRGGGTDEERGSGRADR